MPDTVGADCLTQSSYRRLLTPNGALLDDQSYGFDLRSVLSSGYPTGTDARVIAEQARAEILKDERAASAAVRLLPPEYRVTVKLSTDAVSLTDDVANITAERLA